MNKLSIAAVLLALSVCVQAGTPEILLEACNLFDAAPKRMECLRAATQMNQPQPHASSSAATSAPLAAYAAPPVQRATKSSTRPATSGSATCYVGPRGGTYTITASGRKNYGGC